MDKDRVKGTIDEVVGGAKRQIGNLTGDTRTEIKGAAQQVKGKVENAVGKLKDAARDARDNLSASQRANEESERKKREIALAENRNLL